MTHHGILLVDKPTGMTSHDVVASVRRALRSKEVGHAGTLDPLASGLMVLLLGEATKISDFVLTGNKSYQVRVRFGLQTDSLDITGQTTATFPLGRSGAEIHGAAEKLVGAFDWPIPLYSAAKVDGRKLYEYARKGEEIEQPRKTMQYWDLKLGEVGADFLDAEISCSKGSFIRTWADELGRALGIGGVVESLRRTHSAPYGLASAIQLDALEGIVKCGALSEVIIPLSRTLPDWRAITVRGKDERLIHNGQISYDLERRLIAEQKTAVKLAQTIGIKVLSAESGELLSILEAQPGRGLKIRRVFRNLSLAATGQNQ